MTPDEPDLVMWMEELLRAVAMADPDLYGIWGGTTDPQRRRC
jgi:hypothetical protein